MSKKVIPLESTSIIFEECKKYVDEAIKESNSNIEPDVSMLKPKRIESFAEPDKFENLKDGNWIYNYDIKSQDSKNEEGTETTYSYIPVKMKGKPNYKRCVEAVIRVHITQSQEFDLINTYNKAACNMIAEDEVDNELGKYIQYLNKLSEIKQNVKKDFGIE